MALSDSSKALVVAILSDAMDDADCLPAIQQEEDQASSSAAASTFLALATVKEPLFNHKMEGFVLEDVPRYNDPTFKAHFRMQRATFQVLVPEK